MTVADGPAGPGSTLARSCRSGTRSQPPPPWPLSPPPPPSPKGPATISIRTRSGTSRSRPRRPRPQVAPRRRRPPHPLSRPPRRRPLRPSRRARPIPARPCPTPASTPGRSPSAARCWWAPASRCAPALTGPTELTDGPAATERAGAELARALAPGDVVLISGELGAGKTTYVRGALRELGVEGPVTSPTFVVGHLHDGRQGPLAHLDLYRLAGMAGEDPGLLDPFFD